ncbi:MAG TPA: penicillin acylase family protein, partial [Sphingomonas sp.]
GAGYEMNPKAWSPLLGIETDTTNRDIRALELMGANPKISRDDLYRIKYDTAVSKASYAGPWFTRAMTLDAKGDRQLAAAQAVLRQWDWNYDGRGPADALAALLLHDIGLAHYNRQPLPDPRATLKTDAAYLGKWFGRIDPPLGDVLRLRQGKVDLPLDGGPDVLRAMALWDEGKDGRVAVKHGDSFIMFAEWDRQGRVHSWSVQPFGAATTRPNSPHYADQAALFVKHQLKPVRFTRGELQGHIERIYRP